MLIGSIDRDSPTGERLKRSYMDTGPHYGFRIPLQTSKLRAGKTTAVSDTRNK